MSQEDLKTHVKTLSDDAGLPGLRAVISNYYKNEKRSDGVSELYKSTKKLRHSIHEKDFNKAQQVLSRMAKMSVPSVKQLKLTGAGRLLDTISKRIRNKELRNQALKIISTWKSELRFRQSKRGKNMLRHALSTSNSSSI